mmetsp:Transcript_60397/g.168767  ORF Transcript_60397/g.168767 Transcript_60397/m.168767 type:complete len:320 (-) Transcript_60397:48-1007(-)
MDLLSGAEESLHYTAQGVQADSLKKSMPRWSMSKASRDSEKKVFISSKQMQDFTGRDSPGFNYEPKRQNELPKWSFGTAAARPPARTNKYNEPLNDLLGNIPDSQVVKYKTVSATIGSLPRDAASNAPDFCGYVTGAISPGPQRYNVSAEFDARGRKTRDVPRCIRHGHAPEIDQTPPQYTMRKKTKVLEAESQTGEKVGPGTYPPSVSCGTQADSNRKTMPSWGINRRTRFNERKTSDPGRLWDGMKDQKEKNCRAFSRAPSYGFGTSGREHASRVQQCFTKLDKGPSAFMAKGSQSHPHLPARKEIIRYSDVAGAAG